jgi:hypothetical protein
VQSVARKEAVDDEEIAIEKDQSGHPWRRDPCPARSRTEGGVRSCATDARSRAARRSERRVAGTVAEPRCGAASVDRWSRMGAPERPRRARWWPQHAPRFVTATRSPASTRRRIAVVWFFSSRTLTRPIVLIPVVGCSYLCSNKGPGHPQGWSRPPRSVRPGSRISTCGRR